MEHNSTRECSVEGCEKPFRRNDLCDMHSARLRKTGSVGTAQPSAIYGTVRERLIAHRAIDPSAGCWNWTASTDPRGYGEIGIAGRRKLVHRIAYEEFLGEIPAGLTLDHLCRNRACFNPDHLEPVELSENSRRAAPYRRRAECHRGHPLSGDNLYVSPSGIRHCRTCRREYKKSHRAFTPRRNRA